MKKKKILAFTVLALGASVLYAQVGILGGNGEGGPRLELSGEFLGMYTLGFAGDDQVVALPGTPLGMLQTPHGVFDNELNGRNGFMTRMDFSVLFSPVSWVDLYLQFRARSRVGNPYVPLMLEAGSADDFSLSFENAWGRANVVEGLGLDLPLDVFVQAGLFSAAPASFHRVTRFGAENIMSRHRLSRDPSVQIEGVFHGLPFADSISLAVATGQRFNEAIAPLYDGDGSMGWHGERTIDVIYAFPLFAAVRMRGIDTGMGRVNAELVYALNADGIYSGHNFGANARFDFEVPGMDGMTVPIGLAAAITEKNMDPMARAAHGLGNRNALFLGEGINVNHLDAYMATVSFRRSLRIGLGAGLRFDPLPFLRTEANLGFSYSQIAHIYRETLTLFSASADFRVTYNERFFLGGGVFLGTLADATWRSVVGYIDGEPNPETGFERVFTLAENIGFEIHAGINMGRSRFVLGYNMNRGLSMNHGIEALSDAQTIHMQPGSGIGDNLFQTGGLFAKLVISW